MRVIMMYGSSIHMTKNLSLLKGRKADKITTGIAFGVTFCSKIISVNERCMVKLDQDQPSNCYVKAICTLRQEQFVNDDKGLSYVISPKTIEKDYEVNESQCIT